MPQIDLDFTTPSSAKSSQIADDYIKLGGENSPDNFKDFFGYYSGLKVIFLERLNQKFDEVSLPILMRIDQDL